MNVVRAFSRHWVKLTLSGFLVLLSGTNLEAYTAADAQTMVNAYNKAFYYTTSGNRGYFRNTTDGGKTWFWGRANEMEMLIDLYEQSTNSAYLTQFQQLYNGFISDYGTSWAWNEFNDDIMWMVIACSRAYQKTGNTTYRDVAKSNFDACYARAWSSDLGGGLWWKSPLNTSKNACVNGPAAIAAYLIYQNFNDTNYLAKARSIYLWERATLVDTNTGRVYDSIYYTGSKDTTPITYNQGTFIGAANYLGYTNDAILAANYTRSSMGNGGLLPNYDEHNDLGGFNGIFVRWMVKFMNERNLQSSYQLWLQQNANAAWNMRRTSDNLSWSKWWEPTPEGARYSFGCWGSVLIINLVPPTQIPDGPLVYLNGSDASGLSSFNTGLNWAGGISPSSANHFVVSGNRTLRTPQDGGNHSFAGSSLTLSNGGVLAFKNTSSGRYVWVGTDLFLDGGEVGNWAGNSAYLAGKITLREGGGKIDPQGNSFGIPAAIGGPGILRIGATSSSPLGGTVTLSGVNTWTGGTVLEAAHMLQVSGVGTLGASSNSLSFVNTGRGYGTLNLNGTNLVVGNVNGPGGTIINRMSGTMSVLTVGEGSASDGVFRGQIINGGGGISLVKTGKGQLTLAGANAYTGPTLVSDGTLEFALGASGKTSVLEIGSNAVCRVGTSQPIFGTLPRIFLEPGSRLELNSGILQIVNYLVIDGRVQPAGSYGSSTSSAARKRADYFGGSGVLSVQSTLAAPQFLSASPGDGSVLLQWSGSTGAASYTVYRSTSPEGAFSTLAAGLTSTTYTDRDVVNGVTWYYAVSASSELGESVLSSEVQVTPVGPPEIPSGLAALGKAGEIVLAWQASQGASGYNIKRSIVSGGPYQPVGFTSDTTFTDTGLVNGTFYYYVVSAANEHGESGHSSEVGAQPFPRLVVNLLGSDLVGATSFNQAGLWSNQAAPAVENDYVVGTDFVLRTPTSGSHTFAGGTLLLAQGGTLGLKTGGTITIGINPLRALNMDGGWVGLWTGGQTTVAGHINLQNGGGGFDPQANSPLIVSARISGPGHLKVDTSPSNQAIGGSIILSGSNSYSGGTVIDANMTLKLAGATALGAPTGPLSLLNTNNRGHGTLDLNGNNQDVGPLSGTGGRILNGVSGTAVTLRLGHGNNANSVFAGRLMDGAGVLAVTKLGAGIQTLTDTNTYSGSTTIESGTLALAVEGSISASKEILVRQGAALDVRGRSDGKLTLNAGQSIRGGGSLFGDLHTTQGSIFSPGQGPGEFTVEGSALFAGAVWMEIDRSNTNLCDQLVCDSITFIEGSFVTITNLGPAVQAGDLFQLLSSPARGAISLQLPPIDASLRWVDNLAVDGSLAVAPAVSMEPPTLRIERGASNSIIVAWPLSHTGWRLQSRSLDSNWVDAPGSSASNSVTIAQPALAGELFRLVFP